VHHGTEVLINHSHDISPLMCLLLFRIVSTLHTKKSIPGMHVLAPCFTVKEPRRLIYRFRSAHQKIRKDVCFLRCASSPEIIKRRTRVPLFCTSSDLQVAIRHPKTNTPAANSILGLHVGFEASQKSIEMRLYFLVVSPQRGSLESQLLSAQEETLYHSKPY
jgi:hypothetical protein